MSKEERFRELISGKKTGPGTGVVLAGLRCVEAGYSCVTNIRNRLYDSGWLRSGKVDVPLVSVGNLTLGGTGKTPMIAYLTHWALQRKLRAGIVSRGYGANTEKNAPKTFSPEGTPQTLNDEGMELALRFPKVPQEQSPNRLAACWKLLENRPVDVIFLDDAFQHRRIARDLDIVLLDSQEPFGYGHLFPRGLLRESISSLARADVVLLSRADRVSARRREEIRETVRKIAPHTQWGEVRHEPVSLVSHFDSSESVEFDSTSETSIYFGQQTCPLTWLQGRKVFAFSGIAQPNPFFEMLQKHGAETMRTLSFPDHHHFTKKDREHIAAAAEKSRCEAILCTMKDLVKIRRKQLGDLPLWALAIGIEFLQGEEDLGTKLTSLFHTSHQ